MNEKDNKKNIEIPQLEADLTSPRQGPFRRTFASFKHRNYGYLLTGSFLSNIGTWLQITALIWVVKEITHSPFAVGVVNFLNLFPVFIFVLYAGSVADKVNRRNLLVWTQVFLLIFALILGVMATFKILTMPWIYFLTLTTGIGTAFMLPAYQAMIPEVVPKRDLMNAIALNSAQFNGARMFAPTIAGLVLAFFAKAIFYGAATKFYLNSISYIFVIIALLQIKITTGIKAKQNEGSWVHFIEGIKYANKYLNIKLLLTLIGTISMFGLSFVVVLPFYADIFHTGASGYGILASAVGLGTLIGALTIASYSHIEDKTKLLKWTLFTSGLSLLLFIVSKNYYLALLLLAIFGWAFMASASTINTMVQEALPNEIRGRVMGIYVWMFLGLQPFGSLAYGSIAHLTKIYVPILIGGCVLISTSAVIFIKPSLFKPASK